MQPPFPSLDLDLLIEHAGHQLTLSGSGMAFIATFPSLASLFHFARLGWSFRSQIPRHATLRVAWRGFSIPVNAGR